MKTINVFKRFVLTHADHTLEVFEKGIHEIKEELASHWYVKAHSTPVAAAEAEPTAEPVATVAPVAVPAVAVADPVVEAAPVEAAPEAVEPEAKKKK
jgi:hypothetical protein